MKRMWTVVPAVALGAAPVSTSSGWPSTSGGGFFQETRKKCYSTYRCTVATPWLHNPQGIRTYDNAVVGNNKKHLYSIISYELQRFSLVF